MMNKFHYRGLDNPKVYYNDDYRGFVLNHRSSFNTVIQALLDNGDKANAKKMLLFGLEKMPDKGVRYDFTAAETASLLFQVGEKEKAIDIAKTIGDRSIAMANYLIAEGAGFDSDLRNNVVMLNILQRTLYENGEPELAKKYEEAYNKLLADLQINAGGDRGNY
jgi:hypothetical protein